MNGTDSVGLEPAKNSLVNIKMDDVTHSHHRSFVKGSTYGDNSRNTKWDRQVDKIVRRDRPIDTQIDR